MQDTQKAWWCYKSILPLKKIRLLRSISPTYYVLLKSFVTAVISSTPCARVCVPVSVLYETSIIHFWKLSDDGTWTQIFNQLCCNVRKKPVTLVRSINKLPWHQWARSCNNILLHERPRNDRHVTQSYFKVLFTLIVTNTVTLPNATITTLCRHFVNLTMLCQMLISEQEKEREREWEREREGEDRV